MPTSTCTTTTITSSFEEPAFETSSNQLLKPTRASLRRRHTSHVVRTLAANEQDNITLLIDQFVESLTRRLDFLEAYGQLSLDGGKEMAYSTLKSVRDSCGSVSDEVIGAGRRRAKIIVDELDKMEWYRGALAKKETLEQKVQEGVKIMDDLLQGFEGSAYTTRVSGLGAVAGEFMSEVKREVDSGIEKAKEVVDDAKEAARRAKEALKLSIDNAITSARKHGLITYTDLPEPWRVNPHVLSGYRFHTKKIDCFRSVLGLSNETFNIWSHLVGLIIIGAIAFHFYPSSAIFSLSTTPDKIMTGVFFVAAAKCLICSTLWHTMSSISDQPLMERFACVDYTGISMLVASSIMTTEYAAFYCEPVSRWTYMLLTLGLGIGGTIFPWHPVFNRADMSWLRVVFYCSLACTGFVPVFQLSYSRGWDWVAFFYAPIVKSITAYFVGALLYAAKVSLGFKMH